MAEMALEGRLRDGAALIPVSISIECKVSVAPVTTYGLLLFAAIRAALRAVLAGALRRRLAARIPAFRAAFIAKTQ